MRDAELDRLNEEITQIATALAEEPHLLAMLDNLAQQLQQAAQRRDAAYDVLQQEEADVERLERFSFAALAAMLSGSKEERMEQERREAAAAWAKYDAAKNDFERLITDQERIETKLDALTHEKKRYQQLLDKKEKRLLALGVEESEALRTISAQMVQLSSRQQEIDEAIAARNVAADAAQRMKAELDDASAWGTFDTFFGGGLFTDLAKHDHLDRAKNCEDELRRAMSRLSVELADIGMQQEPLLELGEFATFADFFFDGIFADMFVQGKIEGAQQRAATICENLYDMEWRLEQQLEDVQKECQSLQIQRERLLAAQ